MLGLVYQSVKNTPASQFPDAANFPATPLLSFSCIVQQCHLSVAWWT